MPNSPPAPCAAGVPDDGDGSLCVRVGVGSTEPRPAETPLPIGVPAVAVCGSLCGEDLRCVGL
jgi:hypothetical protein